MAIFCLKMETRDFVRMDRLWEHEPLDEYELEEVTDDLILKAEKRGAVCFIHRYRREYRNTSSE